MTTMRVETGVCGWLMSGIALTLVAATAGAQTTYEVVDLGRLSSTGAYFSYANGLNDRNQVVGFSYVTTGYRAFLYEPATGFLLNLGDLNGGNDSSLARAVTDSGVVVGWSSGAVLVGGIWTTLNRAFRWSSEGGIVDIGADINPNGHSYAHDINENGWVVGYHPPAGVSTFARRGFMWQPGGSVTYLPFLDLVNETSIEPHAITDSGLVVGGSSGSGGAHAFQWDPINGIGTIPGDITDASRARGADQSGVVVGRAVINDGMGGFDVAGFTLGGGQLTLIEAPLGAVRIGAEAMNSQGQVVGSVGFELPTICVGGTIPADPSCYSDLPSDRAFVWTATAGLVDLTSQVDPADPLAGAVVITSALDINDRGSIAANGFIPGQTGQHAFLLVPTVFRDGFESGTTTEWSNVAP